MPGYRRISSEKQNVKSSFHKYRSCALKVNSKQHDVDKGSLTAAANLGKLTLRVVWLYMKM